jgi:hypothetical protein
MVHAGLGQEVPAFDDTLFPRIYGMLEEYTMLPLTHRQAIEFWEPIITEIEGRRGNPNQAAPREVIVVDDDDFDMENAGGGGGIEAEQDEDRVDTVRNEDGTDTEQGEDGTGVVQGEDGMGAVQGGEGIDGDQEEL